MLVEFLWQETGNEAANSRPRPRAPWPAIAAAAAGPEASARRRGTPVGFGEGWDAGVWQRGPRVQGPPQADPGGLRRQQVIHVKRQLIKEMEIPKKTDSPSVVKCHGMFDKGGDTNFVLEYMDGGSLANLVEQKRRMSEWFLGRVSRQVLEGLKYLHAHRIMHRDIKPSNLLINRTQEVKIADFGVGRILSQTLDPSDSYVGTCVYMSPERFDPGTYGRHYDGCAGDIWSLGLTLYHPSMLAYHIYRPFYPF